MSGLKKELRKEFPILQEKIYLDTASCGLVPKSVVEWRRNHDEYLAGNVSEFRAGAADFLKTCRSSIASFFGAQDDEVALVPNFSLGLNMLLDSLPSGQTILMIQDDYPSVSWPVERRDFDVCYAELDENLEQNILKAVKKHKPDIFVFSIVQWISGIKIDLDFLKELKEKNPKMMLIGDGTQYFGTEEFSFNESPFDAVIASSYKWLTSGFGNGFMLIKTSARKDIFPEVIGFQSAETFESHPDETKFMKHFEPGHLVTLNFGSLKKSLEFFEQYGKEMLFSHIKELSTKAYNFFKEKNILLPVTINRPVISTIFNLELSDEQIERMEQSGIVFAKRGGGVRVGFHYYNTFEDLEKLKKVLN